MCGTKKESPTRTVQPQQLGVQGISPPRLIHGSTNLTAMTAKRLSKSQIHLSVLDSSNLT